MPFPCTLEEFKGRVAEFIKAAPTCDGDSLDNGFKAVALSYLNLVQEYPSDVPIAVSYLEYAGKRKMERDLQLAGL